MLPISFVKNIAKTSLFTLALITLLSANIFATPPSGVSSFFKVITDGETQSIALYIPNADAQKVMVTIKNAENEVLFEKQAQVKNGFAQKFDLTGLGDGQYHLVVTDESKVVKQAFQINDKQVEMSKAEQLTFSHPAIQYHSTQKLMQVITFSENPMKVNLYDGKGNIILSETGKQYSKAYNLSSLMRGDYTIEVVCEGESFFKYIRL